MKKYHYIILLAIIAFSFYMNISGIKWGLPTPERTDIVFPRELRNSDFYVLMKNTRDDLYKFAGDSSLGRIMGDKNIGVAPVMASMGFFNKDNIAMPNDDKTLANYIRPYLLRSNHSDEQMTISALARMNFKKLDFDPKIYHYGGSYIYGVGAWLYALKFLGLINLNSDITYYFMHPEKMSEIFIAARFINIAAVLLSALVVFLIARKLYSPLSGLVASAIFSLTPIVVFEAHILKPYCVSTFFALVCLYYALEILDYPDKLRTHILSGLFAGLCIGSMPFYGLIVIAPVTAMLLNRKNIVKNILVFSFTVLAVFLLTNPYWLIDTKLLIFQLNAFGAGKTSGQFSLFIHYFYKQIPTGIGSIFLLFYITGIYLSLVQNRKAAIVLTLSSFLPVMISAWMFKITALSIQNTRFLLPWIGIMAITASGAANWFKQSRIKYTVSILLAFCIVQSGMQSMILVKNFTADCGSKSTRINAGTWILENIKQDSRIGLLDLPSPGKMPPVNFKNYRFDILLDENTAPASDYIVAVNTSLDGLFKEKYSLAASFAPYNSLLGITYDFGISPVNAQVNIYKRNE